MTHSALKNNITVRKGIFHQNINVVFWIEIVYQLEGDYIVRKFSTFSSLYVSGSMKNGPISNEKLSNIAGPVVISHYKWNSTIKRQI